VTNGGATRVGVTNLRAPGPVALAGLAVLLAGGGPGCGPIASEMEPPPGSAVPAPDGGGPGVMPPPLPEDAPPFVAFQRDFQGFESWPRIDLPSAEKVGEGLVHTAGKRTVYVNNLPPKGRKVIPNGTIVVKTIESGETFVQVKRGGGFNAKGAVDWEWFELKKVNDAWVIVWRGIAPPLGACMTNYGGLGMGGACNECHVAFAGNDFIGPNVLLLDQP
jgi:hypothetical protein